MDDSNISPAQQRVFDAIARAKAGDTIDRRVDPNELSEIISEYEKLEPGEHAKITEWLIDPNSPLYDKALESALMDSKYSPNAYDTYVQALPNQGRSVTGAAYGTTVAQINRNWDMDVEIISSGARQFPRGQLSAAEAHAAIVAQSPGHDAVILRDANGNYVVQKITEISGQPDDLRTSLHQLEPPAGYTVTSFIVGNGSDCEMVIPNVATNGEQMDPQIYAFMRGLGDLGITSADVAEMQRNGVNREAIQALITQIRNVDPEDLSLLQGSAFPATQAAWINTLEKLEQQIGAGETISFTEFIAHTQSLAAGRLNIT